MHLICPFRLLNALFYPLILRHAAEKNHSLDVRNNFDNPAKAIYDLYTFINHYHHISKLFQPTIIAEQYF